MSRYGGPDREADRDVRRRVELRIAGQLHILREFRQKAWQHRGGTLGASYWNQVVKCEAALNEDLELHRRTWPSVDVDMDEDIAAWDGHGSLADYLGFLGSIPHG